MLDEYDQRLLLDGLKGPTKSLVKNLAFQIDMVLTFDSGEPELAKCRYPVRTYRKQAAGKTPKDFPGAAN
jgi:hypothetical protein